MNAMDGSTGWFAVSPNPPSSDALASVPQQSLPTQSSHISSVSPTLPVLPKRHDALPNKLSIRRSRTGPTVHRISKVCSECKRMKIACDKTKPCESCKARNCPEKCTYTPEAAARIHVQSLEHRLRVVEGQLAQILRDHKVKSAADGDRGDIAAMSSVPVSGSNPCLTTSHLTAMPIDGNSIPFAPHMLEPSSIPAYFGFRPHQDDENLNQSFRSPNVVANQANRQDFLFSPSGKHFSAPSALADATRWLHGELTANKPSDELLTSNSLFC